MLLVHADGESARRLRDRLGGTAEHPIDVVQLETAAAACERLTEEGFDLILLDLALPDEPGLDGFIRLNAQVPETPVVVITSPATQRLGEAALDVGAADSLVRASIENEPVDEILFAIIQRSRFQQAIRRRSLMDEATGLYSREGFREIAAKHVALASRGGKSLLLSSFELDGVTGSAEEDDAAVQSAAVIVKRSFRVSDLIARVGANHFVAVAIVNASDNSREIVESRIRELLHDHNATHEAPARIRLRTEFVRVEPLPAWSADDVIRAMPKATRVLE